MLKCMENREWRLENGIYRNGSIVDTSFSDRQQDNLYLVEDGSWWFEYRADVITKMLDLFFVKEKLMFDIGGEWIYDFQGAGKGISGCIDRAIVRSVHQCPKAWCEECILWNCG